MHGVPYTLCLEHRHDAGLQQFTKAFVESHQVQMMALRCIGNPGIRDCIAGQIVSHAQLLDLWPFVAQRRKCVGWGDKGIPVPN